MEKIRRATAWITIAVIIGLIIGTLVCAFTGSRYFFGMLFLMLVVPVVLWVFMWFTRLVSGEDDISNDEIGSPADAALMDNSGNGAYVTVENKPENTEAEAAEDQSGN